MSTPRALRILVVEDSAQDQKRIGKNPLLDSLVLLGRCELTRTKHPDEALVALKERPFDLVILDLLFPVLGGGRIEVFDHSIYPLLEKLWTPVIATSLLLDAQWACKLAGTLNIAGLIGKDDLEQELEPLLRRVLARIAPGLVQRRTASEISWLHISDLHYEVPIGGSADRATVEEALLADLAGQRELGTQFDRVFVTGDVAASGKEAEYRGAARFLGAVLEITGVERSHVQLVPGNHDVDRSRIDGGCKAIGAPSNPDALTNGFLSSAKQMAALVEPFAAYRAFVEELLGSQDTHRCADLSFVVKDEARKFAVIGLNSALGSGLSLVGNKVHDKGRLFIGEPMLRECSAEVEAGWFTLVLMHHPLDDLVDFNRSRVQLWLEKHCDLLLHGHLHANDLRKEESLQGGPISTFRSGSSFVGRELVNSYNIATLDLATREYRVRYRRYSDRRQEFVKDLDTTGDALDGETFGTLPRRRGR